MTPEYEKATKLILDKLTDVYGELHAVTMIISYEGKNKLDNVTKVIDKTLRLMYSLIAENEHDKKLCRHTSTVIDTLATLKERLNSIKEKEYGTSDEIGNRQQREKLALQPFNKLNEANRDVLKIVEESSSLKIKDIFEKISSNVDSALSELNTFVTNDPITEALREDLYQELKTLINKTHSIKIQLEQIA